MDTDNGYRNEENEWLGIFLYGCAMESVGPAVGSHCSRRTGFVSTIWVLFLARAVVTLSDIYPRYQGGEGHGKCILQLLLLLQTSRYYWCRKDEIL